MAAVQPPINRINLVSYDMHSHEGLDQTIQNLSNIEEVFNKISSKVESKLQQSKNRLRQLEERRQICMKKIETLAGLNVALTIFSPAKYVKPYKFEENSLKQSLFYDLYLKPHLPKVDSNLLFQNQHSNEELGRAPDIRFEEYTNFINMLYVRLKQKMELFEGDYAIQNKKFEGLGEIPSNLKYVESLLVFDSKINPYKHYSAFDTFQEARNRQPAKRRDEKRQQEVLAQAPETIAQGDTLQHYEQREYNFKPAVKELPQIALPTDLTLKGIVSLEFPTLTDNDHFMPSKGGQTKNLPQIPEPKMLDEPNQGNSNNENMGNAQQGGISNKQSQVPTTYTPGSMVTFNTFNRGQAPVYNAPEPSQNNNNNTKTQTSNPTTTVNNNAPPPPSINLQPIKTVVNSMAPPPPMINLSMPKTGGPPLPPPLINNLASLGVKPDDSAENKERVENKAAPSGEGGGRDALLDEIRCDNPMARLKKVVPNSVKTGGTLGKAAGDGGAAGQKKNEPKQSHMDYLKEMVLTRYQAINKKSAPTKNTTKTKVVKARESDSEQSENSGSESD